MSRRYASSAALACLATLALIGIGCGSAEEFPPPAEPAASPEPTVEPAGKVIELGGEPEGVVADPLTGVVAVGSRDPDLLFLVSETTSRKPEIRKLPLTESPRHLQLAGPGGPVLSTAERTDDLIEIPLPRGRDPRVTKVGDFPHDATSGPGGRIFVADEGGDTVTVVEDGEVVETIPAPIQPGGVVANENGLVAIVAVAERVIRIIDAGTLETLGQTEAGVGATHVVAGADDRFYVADTEGDAVLVVRADPAPVIIDRVNVPGSPYGIAIDPAGGSLWITTTANNELVEFELTDGAPRRVAEYPTVRQPNTVAVDPASGRVHVASRTEGTLQVIDPRTDR